MRILRARNVNDLLVQGLELLSTDGVRGESRAGPVVVAPWPVMSVYDNPTERVLFDPVRDANPFFHLMEGLWMLAGRRDAAFLNNYITDFGERFAESATGKQNWEAGGEIHDAYGHRWRHAMGFDQLDTIVSRLQKDPNDRQCVLQMWDCENHLEGGVVEDDKIVGVGIGGNDDLQGDWKTRPCNTHAYFRVREQVATTEESGRLVLDMTILCRSNDIVWGAYGANAVHFSMLQEYMAGRINVSVGTLYQLSNNYHGYVDVLDRMGDPLQMSESDRYDDGDVAALPMGEDWDRWDMDLDAFMRWHDNVLWRRDLKSMEIDTPDGFHNTWFHVVAGRVAQCRWLWKAGRKQEALNLTDDIEASDWRMACQQWMRRRMR